MINQPVKVKRQHGFVAVRFIDRVKSILGYVAVAAILLSLVALSYSGLIFALAFERWVTSQ